MCWVTEMSACLSATGLAAYTAKSPVFIHGFSKRPSIPKLRCEKQMGQSSPQAETHKFVYLCRKPFLHNFRTNEMQKLLEGQLVGRMLLPRLATGATGI